MDIRVKSFAPEAAGRLDFLCAEYGFMGPEVVPDEAGAYPLLRRVRYQGPGLAIEISLVLSYMGEEYVAAELVSEGGSGSVRRTQIGSGAAHTGYQMRRALDQQAEAVQRVLRDESSPHLCGLRGYLAETGWLARSKDTQREQNETGVLGRLGVGA